MAAEVIGIKESQMSLASIKAFNEFHKAERDSDEIHWHELCSLPVNCLLDTPIESVINFDPDCDLAVVHIHEEGANLERVGTVYLVDTEDGGCVYLPSNPRYYLDHEDDFLDLDGAGQ